MALLMEAYVVIKASLAPLKTALSAARSAVSSAVDAMEGAFKKIYNIGKWAALGIGAYLGVATYEAMKQESAEHALAAALKITGDSSKETMSRFKDFAASIQKVTTYADEDILSQMAHAKILGVTADRLEDVAKAAIGLAARFSIDLGTAFTVISRASQGVFLFRGSMATLRKMIDQTLSPQEKFNKLIEIGTSSFGLAEAAADTTTGRLKQMKNALGEIAETIGEPFRKRLKKWAEDIRDWADAHQEGIKRATDAFDRLLTVGDIIISQFTKPLLEWLGKLTDKFAGFEAEAKLTDAIWAIGKWAEMIWARVKAVWQLIKDLWTSGDLDTAVKYGLNLALAQIEKWGKQLVILMGGVAKLAGHEFAMIFGENVGKYLIDIAETIAPKTFGEAFGKYPITGISRIVGAMGLYKAGAALIESRKPVPAMKEVIKRAGAVTAREVPIPPELKTPFTDFEEAIKNEDELIKAKWTQLKKEFELSQLQKGNTEDEKSNQNKLGDVLGKVGKIGFVGLREAWQQMAIGLVKKGDPNTIQLQDINDNTGRAADATEELLDQAETWGTVGP